MSFDLERLSYAAAAVNRSTMFVNVPMMLTFAFLADPIIAILFGEAWLESVPVLQVLCIAAVLWPVQIVNINALLASGHSRLLLYLEIPKKVLGIVLLLVGINFGLIGVAWSQAVFALFAFFLNAYFTGVHIGYGLRAQITDLVPIIVLASVTQFLVGVSFAYLELSDISRLLLAPAVFFVVYVLFSHIFRLKAWSEFVIRVSAAIHAAHSRASQSTAGL